MKPCYAASLSLILSVSICACGSGVEENPGGTAGHAIDAFVITALPLGHAFGRIGCFRVGDDYGRVTDLPWGIAFPKGTPPTLDPVHPTQLYEIAWLLLGAAILWRRRKRSHFLFGEYLAWNGLGRFFIEFVRVNPKVALGLTEPQLIGLGLIVFGIAGWVYTRDRPEQLVG